MSKLKGYRPSRLTANKPSGALRDELYQAIKSRDVARAKKIITEMKRKNALPDAFYLDTALRDAANSYHVGIAEMLVCVMREANLFLD